MFVKKLEKEKTESVVNGSKTKVSLMSDDLILFLFLILEFTDNHLGSSWTIHYLNRVHPSFSIHHSTKNIAQSKKLSYLIPSTHKEGCLLDFSFIISFNRRIIYGSPL